MFASSSQPAASPAEKSFIENACDFNAIWRILLFMPPAPQNPPQNPPVQSQSAKKEDFEGWMSRKYQATQQQQQVQHPVQQQVQQQANSIVSESTSTQGNSQEDLGKRQAIEDARKSLLEEESRQKREQQTYEASRSSLMQSNVSQNGGDVSEFQRVLDRDGFKVIVHLPKDGATLKHKRFVLHQELGSTLFQLEPVSTKSAARLLKFDLDDVAKVSKGKGPTIAFDTSLDPSRLLVISLLNKPELNVELESVENRDFIVDGMTDLLSRRKISV